MQKTDRFPALVAAMVLALGAGGAYAHGSAGKDEGSMKDGHIMSMKVDYSDVEDHPFGRASDPEKATQTIEIDMGDTMRFSPAEIEVKRGDTVRFVVRNGGSLIHEMVLGTDETLEQHAMMMKKFPGMEHSEPYMAHVPPGGAMEMGWQFTEEGTFSYGCLVPGHFDAGMMGRIVVR